ncbi:DUF2254 domain-containing protein [Cellulomonas sp. PhB150]|uniref:DUF2254 domain-containing protein n=1 Tax=Cellulomonas sp. PhB150 TaxID=2485188 RepID=UPI000F469F8C|nr:DUF2254 domain-containing protein [Cellulomonas sp. PhB150]ROS23834.1 putative membrane protein [Cellulomonas sp. PhB150]
MRGFSGLRARLWWERAFWVLPTIGVLLGAYVAVQMALLDGVLPVSDLVSASAMTGILTAVGGGMVTFTGFVFSFVVLLLQFGSSQYSPRSVSYFLRARSTQVILAIFVGTVAYAFLSVVVVPDEVESGAIWTVGIAVLLLFVSLLAFIALLHSVGSRVRVDAVLSHLGRTARGGMARRLHTARRVDVVEEELAEDDRPVRELRYGGHTGQVVAIDVRRLLRNARRTGSRLEVLVQIGDSVSRGTPVVRVHGPGLDGILARCLVVDVERSLRHDPLYALRLLVDIALRALSPAVNDPTTAVRSLDEIEEVLRETSVLRLGPRVLRAGDGVVVVPRATWQDVVDLALLEITVFGQGQPQVTRRLTAILDDLVVDLDDERAAPLVQLRERLGALVTGGDAELAAVALTADRQGLGGTRGRALSRAAGISSR